MRLALQVVASVVGLTFYSSGLQLLDMVPSDLTFFPNILKEWQGLIIDKGVCFVLSWKSKKKSFITNLEKGPAGWCHIDYWYKVVRHLLVRDFIWRQVRKRQHYWSKDCFPRWNEWKVFIYTHRFLILQVFKRMNRKTCYFLVLLRSIMMFFLF